MAYTTDAALLQQVRDAMSAILSGRAQSYTINLPGGGMRSVTKLDLSDLRAMESDLVARIRAASGRKFGVVRFNSPGC